MVHPNMKECDIAEKYITNVILLQKSPCSDKHSTFFLKKVFPYGHMEDFENLRLMPEKLRIT